MLREYAIKLDDKIDKPRDYIERQLNMTPEENAEREQFFARLFAEHNAAKENGVH